MILAIFMLYIKVYLLNGKVGGTIIYNKSSEVIITCQLFWASGLLFAQLTCLSLCLLAANLASVDHQSKQFGPRSVSTECQV